MYITINKDENTCSICGKLVDMTIEVYYPFYPDGLSDRNFIRICEDCLKQIYQVYDEHQWERLNEEYIG